MKEMIDSAIQGEQATAQAIGYLAKKYRKPVLIACDYTLAAEGLENRTIDTFLQNGVPVYLTAKRAVRALSALTDYAAYLKGRETGG